MGVVLQEAENALTAATAQLFQNPKVIGLLYAGNGTDTFACPIDAVLRAFNCTIAQEQ